MPSRSLWAVTLLFALLAPSPFVCARAASSDVAAPSVESQIDALVAKALEQPFGAGISVGMARGGKLLLAKGYGLAEVEHGVPAQVDTLFRIGSVTKQFTAAAILKLVEEKKIALDDPLTKFVDFPTQGNTVTIRHLLNHTSGIPSYTGLGDAWREKWPLELTDDQLLDLVRDRPFDFAPGEKWAYNNTGYYLLGMIIEKVTGTPYGGHLRETFFDSLGIERTRYDSNRDLIPNRAQGYGTDEGKLANDHLLGMSQPGAAGALISTGGELVRWSMALASGRVVEPQSFAAMTTPTTLTDGTVQKYGYGLGTNTFEGRRRVHHGGGIMGFNSMLFWLPDEDLHVAVISNSEAISSGRIADEIARAVLGIEVAASKDVPVSKELRASLIGKYRLEQVELDMVVSESEEKLLVQATGQPTIRLLWQGGDGREFHAAIDPDIRLVFALDGNSFQLHQAGQTFGAKRIEE